MVWKAGSRSVWTAATDRTKRGWVKITNPTYWHRDAEREASFARGSVGCEITCGALGTEGHKIASRRSNSPCAESPRRTRRLAATLRTADHAVFVHITKITKGRAVATGQTAIDGPFP